MYSRTPMQQYSRQKAGAKNRGIGWCFTFESWMKLWADSGKFEQRGAGADQYVMARIGDVGPYSPENVKIIKMRENCSEAHTNKPPRDSRELSLYSLGKGRGWTRIKCGYQVTFRRKYVGVFKTQAEAESVYRSLSNQFQSEAA